jgi:hypothetical protein
MTTTTLHANALNDTRPVFSTKYSCSGPEVTVKYVPSGDLA